MHALPTRQRSFTEPLSAPSHHTSHSVSLHITFSVQGGHSEPGLWVLRRTGDVRSKYILGEVLGRGQFGVVCIAIDKAKGTRWALKSVSKRRVQVCTKGGGGAGGRLPEDRIPLGFTAVLVGTYTQRTLEHV
jgi:hypothetical protein